MSHILNIAHRGARSLAPENTLAFLTSSGVQDPTAYLRELEAQAYNPDAGTASMSWTTPRAYRSLRVMVKPAEATVAPVSRFR